MHLDYILTFQTAHLFRSMWSVISTYNHTLPCYCVQSSAQCIKKVKFFARYKVYGIPVRDCWVRKLALKLRPWLSLSLTTILLTILPLAINSTWWFRLWRICLQCRRPGFDPWVRKIPWQRAWQPTPVFLPGESHGQRSLAGYSPWGCKESDMPEQWTHSCYQFLNNDLH